MEKYNFHVGCFLWIQLHHGEKVVKSWEKIRKFPYLEKFCYEIFQIQNPNFQNWFSWWTSFMFWHILMNYDPWHLILTKKSKFDFSVYSWLLISWLQISSVDPMNLRCFESSNWVKMILLSTWNNYWTQLVIG